VLTAHSELPKVQHTSDAGWAFKEFIDVKNYTDFPELGFADDDQSYHQSLSDMGTWIDVAPNDDDAPKVKASKHVGDWGPGGVPGVRIA
jgi:hypothetical protein